MLKEGSAPRIRKFIEYTEYRKRDKSMTMKNKLEKLTKALLNSINAI